jgi:hypothetical protein
MRTSVAWTAGLCCVATSIWGATAAAAQEQVGPVLTGFISSTTFVQSDAFGFGNGQNAQWVRAARVGTSDRVTGADVRNTRLTLLLPSTQVSTAFCTGGLVEIDFFGGFNGAGPYADEQPVPRLRSAYAEIGHGRTILRVGQAFAPIFGNVPVSPSHLAFPLGYGAAGTIGFRSPGVFLLHDFADPTSRHRVGLQLAAFRGSWNGPGDLTDHGSAAEAAAVPQIEARLDLGGRVGDHTRWSTYIVGHYDEKQLGSEGAPTILAGRAIAAGARIDHGMLTIHGNGYTGRAIGQQLGQLAQFGDIGGGGAWVQAGLRPGAGLSAWAFVGQDDPDDAELLGQLAGDVRLRNRLGAASLQWTAGGYTAGLQWLRAGTDWGARTAAGDTRWYREADQLSFSVLYRF